VNKAKASSNGLAYVSGAIPATVSVDILNTHAKPQDDILIWKIYSSDMASDENLVVSKTETVKVSPGKKAAVSVSVPKVENPSYYVIGELKDGGKSSFITVRIVRSDVSKSSFTMLGVTPFPFEPGGIAAVFGCVLKSYPADDGAKVITVRIVGPDRTIMFAGKADMSSTSMSGFFENLKVPKQGGQSLRLVANIVDGSGSVIATSVVSLCDGAKCSQSAPAASFMATAVYYLSALSIVAVLAILAIVLVKRRGKAPGGEDQTDHV
jgi:hypothetical protein